MQKYLASNYPLMKYLVSKVYTTKKGVNFVYLKDNTTITLPELDVLGESYTTFSSLAKTRDQAEQEYKQAHTIPSAMPTKKAEPTFWEKFKQLFKRA